MAQDDDRLLAQQVFAERLRQLSLRERSATLSAPLGYLVLAYIQWPVVPHARVLLWVAMVALADLASFLCCQHVLSRPPPPERHRRWLARQTLAFCGSGLSWGLAKVLLYVPGHLPHELATQLFLCAVGAVTLVVFSTFRSIVLLFVLALWLPSVLHFFWVGDTLHTQLGVASLVYIAILVQYGWIVSNDHVDGIRALLENQQLAARLSAAQQATEASNRELQRNNEELRLALRTINKLATHDELTHCYNRRYLMNHLAQDIPRAKRYDQPLTLLMLDLDHFKAINDTHGHPVGDAVLQAVATRIAGLLRESDLFARYGGEEFACVLPDTDAAAAAVVAERVREDLAAASILRTPVNVTVTVSIGLAQLQREDTLESWLDRADQALYRAKRYGRNRVVPA